MCRRKSKCERAGTAVRGGARRRSSPKRGRSRCRTRDRRPRRVRAPRRRRGIASPAPGWGRLPLGRRSGHQLIVDGGVHQHAQHPEPSVDRTRSCAGGGDLGQPGAHSARRWGRPTRLFACRRLPTPGTARRRACAWGSCAVTGPEGRGSAFHVRAGVRLRARARCTASAVTGSRSRVTIPGCAGLGCASPHTATSCSAATRGSAS